MAREKGQIGLRIAARSRPEKGSFDYRSASVTRWIRELPVGNIGQCARHVYEALHEVNRLGIPWRERYQLLELMREPVHYVQSSLLSRFSGLSFPLPDKSRKIAMLTRALYDEMALGYKTSIEEMLGNSFLNRDNKILTILIHRAVRYLSQSMLTCYRTYTPHPHDIWFELHLLYLYAEHKNIYQNPVQDKHNTLMAESSIARVYKQILLLALTSPYRLRQGEAETVYDALARWAGHAHIIPYNAPSASTALFVVHMDSDTPPDYKTFDHRDCNTELCRLVDTQQLSRILQDALEHEEKGESGSPLRPGLLRLLIRTWSVAPRRNFSRNNRHSAIEVVVGTAGLHRALAHELPEPFEAGKPASYASRNVTTVAQKSADDVWNIFSSEKMKKNYEHYRAMTEEEEKGAEANGPKSETWQICNESAGGYRLALDAAHTARVQVGELVGLRHNSDSDKWQVGVIRWLRQSPEGELEVGVQTLAPEALPVMARNRHAGGKAGEYQYALLLPEIPVLKQPASLIAPTLLFQPGDALTLRMPANKLKITLRERLQDSGNFVQFLFDAAEQTAQHAEHGQEPSAIKPGDALGSVWEVL